VISNFYAHEHEHGLLGSARSYCDEGENPASFAGLSDLFEVCGDLFWEEDSERLVNFIVEHRNWRKVMDGGDDFFADPYENVWKDRCWFENSENLWYEFSENVKYRARFFDHPSYSRTDFLESLEPTFEALLTTSYPKIFYRARIIDSGSTKKKILSDPETELDKPPNKYAGYNRFSPAGISYIYLADSLETALVEIGVEVGNECAYGVFEIEDGLKIVDLKRRTLLENLDWFDDEFSSSEFCFLSNFTTEIALPIKENDKLIDYVPTQIVAEFIWSKGYDGFLYDSSLSKEGFNLVLFERGYKMKRFEESENIVTQSTCTVNMKIGSNLSNMLLYIIVSTLFVGATIIGLTTYYKNK
jgi:hypothetical protein